MEQTYREIKTIYNHKQNKTRIILYELNEHDISLHDSLLQIMTEPTKFTLLNIDKTSSMEYYIDSGNFEI